MPRRTKEWSGVLTLRSKLAKQMPCHIVPAEDRDTGKIYTGQGYMTEQQKADCALIVTPHTRFTLKNGLRIDLNDPVDAIQWAWVQHHPYVAWSESEVNSSEAIFYVENKAEKAKISMDREKETAKAKYFILYQASKEAKLDAAKVLGISEPAVTFPDDDQLNNFLVKKVDEPVKDGSGTHSATILRLLDPQHAEETEAQKNIEELIEAGIIWRAKGGVWKWGSKEEGITVGRAKNNVLAWMLKPENFDDVEEMLQQLEEAKAAK